MASLDEIKKLIRSLLVSTQQLLTEEQLNKDFVNTEGKPIPYQQFGYRSLHDFLESITDTVHVVRHEFDKFGPQKYYVRLILNESIAHLEDMVLKQRINKNMRGPVRPSALAPRSRSAQVESSMSNRPPYDGQSSSKQRKNSRERGPAEKSAHQRKDNRASAHDPLHEIMQPLKPRHQEIMNHDQSFKNQGRSRPKENSHAFFPSRESRWDVHKKVKHHYNRSEDCNGLLQESSRDWISYNENVGAQHTVSKSQPSTKIDCRRTTEPVVVEAAAPQKSLIMVDPRMPHESNHHVVDRHAAVQRQLEAMQHIICAAQEVIPPVLPSECRLASQNKQDASYSASNGFCKRPRVQNDNTSNDSERKKPCFATKLEPAATMGNKNFNVFKQPNSNIVNHPTCNSDILLYKVQLPPSRSSDMSASTRVNSNNNVSAKQKVPDLIVARIYDLFKKNFNGIQYHAFDQLYQREYGEELHCKTYGFNDLISLLDSLEPYSLKFEDRTMKMVENKDKTMSLPYQMNLAFVQPQNTNYFMVEGEDLPPFYFSPDLKKGSVINIKCGEIYNPRKFYLIIYVRNYGKKLDMLMDQMQKVYGQKNVQSLQIRYPHENMYVACIHMKEWHRARIIRVNANTCELICVDYGTVVIKTVDQLYFLYKDFGTLAPQAIQGALYNIKPLDNAKLWSSASAHKFFQLASDVLLSARITDINIKEKKLEVFLTDTSKEQDVCINDVLVQAGYAAYNKSTEGFSSDLMLVQPKQEKLDDVFSSSSSANQSMAVINNNATEANFRKTLDKYYDLLGPVTYFKNCGQIGVAKKRGMYAAIAENESPAIAIPGNESPAMSPKHADNNKSKFLMNRIVKQEHHTHVAAMLRTTTTMNRFQAIENQQEIITLNDEEDSD